MKKLLIILILLMLSCNVKIDRDVIERSRKCIEVGGTVWYDGFDGELECDLGNIND